MKKVIFIILLVISGAFILAPLGSCVFTICSAKPIEAHADMVTKNSNGHVTNVVTVVPFTTVWDNFNHIYNMPCVVQSVDYKTGNLNRIIFSTFDNNVSGNLSGFYAALTTSGSFNYDVKMFRNYSFVCYPNGAYNDYYATDFQGFLKNPRPMIKYIAYESPIFVDPSDGETLRADSYIGFFKDVPTDEQLNLSGFYDTSSVPIIRLRLVNDYSVSYRNYDVFGLIPVTTNPNLMGIYPNLELNLDDITPWKALVRQVDTFFDIPILGNNITFGTICLIGFGCLLVTIVLKTFLGG